jgi:hypothetical protein
MMFKHQRINLLNELIEAMVFGLFLFTYTLSTA